MSVTITSCGDLGLRAGDVVAVSGLATGGARVVKIKKVASRTCVHVGPWTLLERLFSRWWWSAIAWPTVWSWNPCNGEYPHG